MSSQENDGKSMFVVLLLTIAFVICIIWVGSKPSVEGFVSTLTVSASLVDEFDKWVRKT